MPAPKQTNQPRPAGVTESDQTWSYYDSVLIKIRKMCHGDEELARQAEARIRAKLVTAEWEAKGRPHADVFAISKRVDEIPLDGNDQKAIADLQKRKVAFRDRLCAALGKVPQEGWDSFYRRISKRKTIPNTVRQFELMSKP